MSSKLLQHFIQDDLDSFKRVLANINSSSGGHRPAPLGSSASKTGSPGIALASSPNPSGTRNKKHGGTSPGASLSERAGQLKPSTNPSTRAQINARDQYGRTILHHIASSQKTSAVDFATALLEIPLVDIYIQDLESGWTALHRALYAGNASIAQALMSRDIRDAIDFSTPTAGSHHPSGGLIKIKDREGNSPFDVYAATTTTRDIRQVLSFEDGYPTLRTRHGEHADTDDTSSNHSDYGAAEDGMYGGQRTVLKPRINLQAQEVFTFGSNKNLTLGLGDEDDRQFPERIAVERPEHLLHRFYHERLQAQTSSEQQDLSASQDMGRTSDLPTLIRYKPVIFQDVVMSKLHTAVLTDDPEANLFMCGFGPGGRLGTGDESTRFDFVCIQSGGLAKRRIVTVALGQDHSIAISEQGEIFTWGSNKYGQLGYNLPHVGNNKEVPIQTTPRQIFNPFKREIILGAAASSIHSVVFSSSGLYTFGKNEGQLGLVDADARSLGVQVTPRRVGAWLINSAIQMVSAIDRATIVLLGNHDVWVFTQYGYSKVVFPLDFTSPFVRDSFRATRYSDSANRITKITSGRNTICAMSSFGEVYTILVNQRLETSSIAASTTNPAKIRNSLPSPERVWSVRKSHMAVADVDVGQDGSIIICTSSGSAWRKEKRAKIKEEGSKDYKFVRIPGLSSVVAVRSNAYGAYAVAQRECDVTKTQINVEPSTLWQHLLQLLPFKSLEHENESALLEPAASGSSEQADRIGRIKAAILTSSDAEHLIQTALEESKLSNDLSGSIWTRSTVSDVRIPVHEFLIAARSPVLRSALADFRQSYYFSIPDVLAIEYDQNGQIQVTFQGLDFLTLLNLVFFLYTDNVIDVWHSIRHSSKNAFRFRQVRTEVMRIATHLEMKNLERAARVMIDPIMTLNLDMEKAIKDNAFYVSCDVTIQLDGGNARAHSQFLCQRCPFFEGLFHGRSGGRWLSSRREAADDLIHVDLKNIEPRVFSFVLRHIYGDTEEELFEDVRCNNLDDFIDLILDVMSAANELMIDRLAQICQKMLGQFVNTRNVCHLLNAVAPCSVTEFKDAALEFICLNLEVMLENRLLKDLDEELLFELDEICQENQLARYPVSRGRNSEEFVFEKYPELVDRVEIDKQRRIDSLRLRSRLDQDQIHDEKIRVGSIDKSASPISSRKTRSPQVNNGKFVHGSPMLHAKQSTNDLMFQMDEESTPAASTSSRREDIDSCPPLVSDDVRSGHQHQESPSEPVHASLHHVHPSVEAGSMTDRNHLADETIQDSPFGDALTPSPKTSSKPVWGSAIVSGNKRDLKEIMAEASTSRVSNLTIGMAQRQLPTHVSASTSKLSQKERKKLQQQQSQEIVAAQQEAKESTQSPWQTPARLRSPTAALASGGQRSIDADLEASKAMQRPSMTLRQTLSGVPSTKPKPSSSPLQATTRSVSNPPLTPTKPATSPRGHVSQAPAGPPTTISPAIQSIRHTPRPEPKGAPYALSSSRQSSLASILIQQQAEKDEIREAATAKHNLSDIQAEQEFQEWWDKESKRVMEEAEAEAAAAAARKAGPRSKGRNRGVQNRGRVHKDGSDNLHQAEQSPSNTPLLTSAQGSTGTRKSEKVPQQRKASNSATLATNNSKSRGDGSDNQINPVNAPSPRGPRSGRPRHKGKERLQQTT